MLLLTVCQQIWNLVKLIYLKWLSKNISKNVISDLAIPLARDNLRRLVSNLASNSINKF